MFCRTWRWLAVSKAAVESYMDYLQGADRELPALSEILPRHQLNSKDLLEFHSLLCEVMQDNGFKFMGIKVVPPTAGALQSLRATEAVCMPIFSDAFQNSTLSTKQHRVQCVEPLFVLRLGCDAPSQIAVHAAPAVCDVFRPGIEITGSRFPFYPPHSTGFAADLGGCIALSLGKETELSKTSLDTLSTHQFVLTRKNEPLQVGSARNCLGSPSMAVALAVNYAVSIGKPLGTGHYVFCSGVGSRSPAIPGDYQVNYGVYGDTCVLEEKVFVSVREDDEVKVSPPNMMKKLTTKQMEEYTLYPTRDGRKSNYERPVNPQDKWNEQRLSTAVFVYLTKKEPPVMEELLEIVEKSETLQRQNDQHKDFTPESDAVDAAPTITQHIEEKKGGGLDRCSQFPCTLFSEQEIPSEFSFRQKFLLNHEGTLALPSKLSENVLKADIPISTFSNDHIAKKSKNVVSSLVSSKFLPGNDSHVESKEVLPLPVSSGVNYCGINDPRATTSPIVKNNSVGKIDNDVFMHRCERTTYVVSLYEFAHLESQRQHRRAEKLLSDAQKRPPRAQPVTPKPLYKI